MQITARDSQGSYPWSHICDEDDQGRQPGKTRIEWESGEGRRKRKMKKWLDWAYCFCCRGQGRVGRRWRKAREIPGSPAGSGNHLPSAMAGGVVNSCWEAEKTEGVGWEGGKQRNGQSPFCTMWAKNLSRDVITQTIGPPMWEKSPPCEEMIACIGPLWEVSFI